MDNLAQRIQLLVVSGTDDSSVLEKSRRVIGDGALNHAADVLERIHPIQQSGQVDRLYLTHRLLELRQFLCGKLQRAHLPRCDQSVDNAGNQPLHIKNIPQLLADIIQANAVTQQFSDRIEAFVDGCWIKQRLFQHRADETFSHRGLGLVEHPQQSTAAFSAAQGAGQLQIAPCGQIERHILLVAVYFQMGQAFQAVLLRLCQIMDHRSQRKNDRLLSAVFQLRNLLAAKLVRRKLSASFPIKIFFIQNLAGHL